MLHPPEAFFFGGGNKDAVSDDCRRGISVKSVEAKNYHSRVVSLCNRVSFLNA